MFRESQDVQITLDDRMLYANDQTDRKSTRLNSSHLIVPFRSRMPSSA